MLGQRCLIGAFPWRYEGSRACPCRIIAFLDRGDKPSRVGEVLRKRSSLLARMSIARRQRREVAKRAAKWTRMDAYVYGEAQEIRKL